MTSQSGLTWPGLRVAITVSSTGDPMLDAKLPFDEPYYLPVTTVRAILETKARHGHVIALGTTVTRALEHAAVGSGTLRAGHGLATQRIGSETQVRVVDAIVTGVHQLGTSHYELLRAFASDDVLGRMSDALEQKGFRTHEFGDSVLLPRQRLPADVRAPEPAERIAASRRLEERKDAASFVSAARCRNGEASRVASDAADCELLSQTHTKTHNTGCSRRKSPTPEVAVELDLHSVGTAGFEPAAPSTPFGSGG